jgi:hypothetical protein
MAKKKELSAVISEYMLNNTSMISYFERFENDEDLMEEKLEEFCNEVDAILEDLFEELEDEEEDEDEYH